MQNFPSKFSHTHTRMLRYHLGTERVIRADDVIRVGRACTLLQNKYLHFRVDREGFLFFLMNQSARMYARRSRFRQGNALSRLRSSSRRHISMNRQRYVLYTNARAERDRDLSLSLIRKTRQSTRKFLPWDKRKGTVREPGSIFVPPVASPRRGRTRLALAR